MFKILLKRKTLLFCLLIYISIVFIIALNGFGTQTYDSQRYDDIKKYESQRYKDIKKDDSQRYDDIKKYDSQKYDDIKKYDSQRYDDIKKYDSQRYEDIEKYNTKRYEDTKNNEPKWLHKFVLPYAEFRPQTTPIVIFSNYRHKYLRMCLEGIQSATQDIERSTPCILVLHRINTVTEEDIELTLDMIQHVKFCKVKILEMNRHNPVQTSSKTYKFLWWSVVQDLFNATGLLSKEMPGYEGDIFFLEEDAIVSPDFMRVLWYTLRVKNSFGPDIYQVALGGYDGENVINAHADTFAVRKTCFFQAMAYAFNASFWKLISEYKKLILHEGSSDFSESITYWIYHKKTHKSFHLVVPTLSRMWHVGSKGLGMNGDGSVERHVTKTKPWELVPRLLDLSKAEVNAGIRDVFGFLCSPGELMLYHFVKDAKCKWSDANFVNKHAIQCHIQPFVNDKCALETVQAINQTA